MFFNHDEMQAKDVALQLKPLLHTHEVLSDPVCPFEFSILLQATQLLFLSANPLSQTHAPISVFQTIPFGQFAAAELKELVVRTHSPETSLLGA